MSESGGTTPDEEELVSTTYFEKIPVWSADGTAKKFEIMADDISGRIPVTRLESWRDFTELLESEFFNRAGVQYAFRGHRRYDWSLMPTLGRLVASGIVSEDLAQEQLALFKRAVRGRIPDPTLVDEAEEDELWSVGQHHGLMTPLLDWTYSPYVALFFAFAKEDREDETEENIYRAVYVINKTFVDDDDQCPGIRVLEPRKDNHGRLVNQAGLFTFSPYDATIENKLTEVLSAEDSGDEELKNADEESQPDILAKYICKIYIRNEGRDACLRHLRRMNVHHASLFPDLLGASEYCNVLISERYPEATVATKAAEPQSEDQPGSEPNDVPAIEIQASTPIPQPSPSILKILSSPESAGQIEPHRLGHITQSLQLSLSKALVVDWTDRDSAKARLRNLARSILRRNGYPAIEREAVVEQVLDYMADRSRSDEGEEEEP